MFGEEGISVGEAFASCASIVYAVLSVGVACFLLEVVEKVYVFVPVGALVDFLEGDDVRLVLVDDSSDAIKVLLYALFGVESLIEGKSSPVGDIEGHEACVGHREWDSWVILEKE